MTENEYQAKRFQSTPSVGRATIVQGYRFPNIIISIHALRGEGDARVLSDFYSRRNISIHALRGEGDPFNHLPLS